ncbi:hypothetical protein K435DRAFT_865908 [Dendrothele bispora CBS 962.96]|uniref:DUF6532 domain-containing protein n=1 Tax=Dendrothele bispora (strain CBS 962.96) TaxID=1314807 RepID=A0A4S8LIA2_DENBC|nr:hypothetical protein K435DRAFT_865908 [Dendrothele bispora CBS 962.96]
MASRRSGKTSTADGRLPVVDNAPVEEETVASKTRSRKRRKEAIDNEKQTAEQKSSQQQPPPKRAKALPANKQAATSRPAIANKPPTQGKREGRKNAVPTLPVKATAKQVSKATAANRRGKPPVIHGSDSEEGPEAEVQPKRQSASKDRQEDSEIDEENEENDDIGMLEDERGADQDASRFLAQEAPHFTRDSTGGGEGRTYGRTYVDHDDNRLLGYTSRPETSTRSSSPFDWASIPPASDGEGFTSGPNDANSSDEDDPEDEQPIVVPPKKLSKKRKEKLAEELPVVSEKNLPTSHSHSATNASLAAGHEQQGSEANVELESKWHARTNIVLDSYTPTTRTFTISLTSQNTEIKAVIDKTLKYGTLMLISDDGHCGLSITGLKALAYSALISAAEDEGYDGEYDIADRLERGDSRKYKDPLIKYVCQRISLERKKLKDGLSATIFAALDIDHSPDGIEKAGDLLRQSNYIYPLLSTGGYDYNQPFRHPVIVKYLSAVIFGNGKFSKYASDHKAALFKSSVPEKPLEFELPKAMLAMAGCVIHAVLLEHGKPKADNFPPPGLQTQWGTFLDIMDRMEARSKMSYHKFVHELYLRSSHSVAPATHGLSRAEILKRINFQTFDDNQPQGPENLTSASASTSALT